MADLWVFTSLFEAFSCFDFCQRNLVKENMNLWQISLVFCTTKCTFMVWLHWQKFCHSVQFFRHFSVTLWSGILPPRIPRPEIVKEIIRKLLEILSWNPVGWKILVFENSRNCTEFAQNSRICAELQNLHRIPEFVQNLRRISTELTRHFWDFLDCFGEILSHRKILCQNSGPKSNRNVTEKDAEWKNFC